MDVEQRYKKRVNTGMLIYISSEETKSVIWGGDGSGREKDFHCASCSEIKRILKFIPPIPFAYVCVYLCVCTRIEKGSILKFRLRNLCFLF